MIKLLFGHRSPFNLKRIRSHIMIVRRTFWEVTEEEMIGFDLLAVLEKVATK